MQKYNISKNIFNLRFSLKILIWYDFKYLEKNNDENDNIF